MRKNNNYFIGAAILSLAGIIIKILGAVYRIPLMYIIGTEGIAYYQTAYPLYTMILTVGTSGFPVAIAKLVSEKTAIGDYRNAYNIFKLSLKLMTVVGVVGSSLVLIFSSRIVELIENENAYYALIALTPALLIAPITSAFKGFFQGRQYMVPTAISQTTEQLFRVISGLSLTWILLGKGLPMAAGGASFGATIGIFFGAITIIMIFARNKRKITMEIETAKSFEELKSSEILKKVIAIAIPITIGAGLMPLMDAIDSSIFITRLLSAGFEKIAANELFGIMKGMSQTLVVFPQVFTVAIAISLVPTISELFTKNKIEKVKETISSGIKLTMMITSPCAVGFFVLSYPIMSFIFPRYDAITLLSAAKMLQIASFSLILIGVTHSTTAIIQGLGNPVHATKNLMIATITKFIFAWILIGTKEINIYGIAISTILAFLIASILNTYFIVKREKMSINFTNVYFKPILSAAMMGVIVYIIDYNIKYNSRITTIIEILIGVIVYVFTLFLTKTIKKNDILLLPKGEKIYNYLKKIKAIK